MRTISAMRRGASRNGSPRRRSLPRSAAVDECSQRRAPRRLGRAPILAFASVILLTMTSRGNIVFGICAFDSSILVDCADSEIRDALDRYLFPPLPRSNLPQSSPDVHIRCRQELGISFESRSIRRSQRPRHAPRCRLAAVKALDDAVVHRMKMFRAVHAGALLDKMARHCCFRARHTRGSLLWLLNSFVEAHPIFPTSMLSSTIRASRTLILVHFCSATDVRCSRWFCLKNSMRELPDATSARRLDSGPRLRSRRKMGYP